MAISNECMTTNLSINTWLGHRLDREASRKVTSDAGADADAARVNKHLVPKDATKDIVSAANALRAHFYANTLPWKDSGDRILTRKRFPTFIEEHEKLKESFNKAVDTFLTVDYLKARDRAEFRMGDLFDPSDYPSPAQLRRKFAVTLDIDAVTEGKDFRVDISNRDQLAADIERKKADRLGKAMGHLWERLADTLGHFADKMSGDSVFRNTTVSNLEELVDMLDDMNVTGDQQLESIRQRIKDNLTGFEPNDLRKKPEVRNAVAEQANQIMADMRGFMTAMEDAA